VDLICVSGLAAGQPASDDSITGNLQTLNWLAMLSSGNATTVKSIHHRVETLDFSGEERFLPKRNTLGPAGGSAESI
jgi:hypothetical protein